MNKKVSVLIRIDKEKLEELKKVAREKSYKEQKDITYNELIVQSVYKEYFGEM